LKDKDRQLTMIDPAEYELPILKERHKYLEDPSESIEKLHQIFTDSDGFILVACEYNHGISSALKNILDHFYFEFYFKACGIVSYSTGGFGGIRSADMLRLICSTMGMPPIPHSVAISNIKTTLTEEGETKDENLLKSFKKFTGQFEWYLNAYKTQREKGVPK
ncbi:MAG: NADPH-dependent FMN reductase, partial [Bacteroidia bacterium]